MGYRSPITSLLDMLMKSTTLYLLVGAIISLSVTGISVRAEAPDNESTQEPSESQLLGRRVMDFVVADATGDHATTGKPTALSDFQDKFVVAIFMGTACPIANSYIPTLNAIHERYHADGVQVIGINSNLQDSPATIREHVQEYSVKFPVLIDSEQIAADVFGATRTPQAFILDRRRNIRYHGRIDDRIGYTFKRPQARRADLEEALKELLAGKPVSVPVTSTEGCLITRRSSLQKSGEVTYAKHVASILHKRCAECHHSGTAAPFSLLTYEDARNWSQMIRETVVQRRMPPWSADPRYGKFSNDLRLTTDEVTKIVSWIDAGAPLGDPSDLPPTPQYATDWVIGKPDKIFTMPEEYTVQASGTVAYQYFVTPTNFKQDMWIQAAEARPGNRKAVHHIIAFIRPPGSSRRRLLTSIGGYAPGEEPVVYPAGVGKRLPAGWEIVWQMHYTPTGKVEKDRSELGLIFCKEPPQRAAQSGMAINVRIRIPANEGEHPEYSEHRFTRDVDLLTLMPHMHVRGKSFQYKAFYPDGSERILLNVPDYDFNWQHRYRFAEPLHIPKGTVLRCRAVYDNSAENPANPDPEKSVRWGDQTWEEMMIGFYTHVDPTPTEPPAPTPETQTTQEAAPPAAAAEDKPAEDTPAKPDDKPSTAKQTEPAAEDADTAKPDNPPAPKEPLPLGQIVKRTYHFDAADEDIEYRLYVPKSYDKSKPSPLIVALHGLYSSPNQIIRYPGFLKRAEQHGYIVVAPMGYNTRGWYGSRGSGGGRRRGDPENLGELSEQDVMNVLQLMRDELNIDDRRIYLYGHSMGGGGSLHLATKFPKLWAGFAVVAPASDVRRLKLDVAKHIPAVVIHGTKDRLVPAQVSRRLVEMMKELEIPHKYIEVKDGDHRTIAWQYFDEIFQFWNDQAAKSDQEKPKPESPEQP